MDEKKERSYAKESTKSTPSGIRFDLDKLAFVQKRENLPLSITSSRTFYKAIVSKFV
jgi:hypothetical protein